MPDTTSPPSTRKRNPALLPTFLLFFIVAVLVVVNQVHPETVPYLALRVARCAALVSLMVYAVLRRSLTTWILVAMVVGAEIGHDWPGFATNLRVLSLIFLRLIKTIIAPLIFATLVVGIAGHSNL